MTSPRRWLVVLACVGCLQIHGLATSVAGAAEAPLSWNVVDDAGDRWLRKGPMTRPPLSVAVPELVARLEAAIRSRDRARMVELYQTNGVPAPELQAELERWPAFWARASEPTVRLYLKEMALLPPTARQVWGNLLAKLTSRPASHLAMVSCGSGAQMTVPLLQVDGRLLLVTSGRGTHALGEQPDGRPADRIDR